MKALKRSLFYSSFILFSAAFVILSMSIISKMQIRELQLNQIYTVLIKQPNDVIFNDDISTQSNIKTPAINFPQYQYKVKMGDDLQTIFKKLAISSRDKAKIFNADRKHKQLEKLKIGDVLKFWLAKDGRAVLRLEIEYNPEMKISFVRNQRGNFLVKKERVKGHWQQEVVSAKVIGNFSISAYRAGLSFKEIDSIKKLLLNRINIVSDLRAGDNFSVIRSRQYVNGELTGKSTIEAVKVKTKEKNIAAYLHIDGNYYDKLGKPVSQSFLRYPTKYNTQISSHFNPERKHPVSKRDMPHNGTDFFANTGTNVIATSDGIVKIARSHPIAGKYLVIEHGHQLLTRYLHNSKLLVKKGDKVKKGQLIAKSGRSGRVTGPHIHYELWVNGKAINPMKAILPFHQSVPKFQRSLYVKLVNKYDQIMNLTGNSGIIVSEFDNKYQDTALAMKERK